MRNKVDYLLLQYKNNSISNKELSELISLIQNKDFEPEIKQTLLTDLIINSNYDNSKIPDAEKTYQPIYRQVKKSNHSYGIRKLIGYNSRLIAASFLGIIIMTSALWFLKNYEHFNTSYYSANDTIKNITLPDGSHVTLNKQSELSYYETWLKHSRMVNLEGEALFNVATNGKVFIVKTKNINIKVTGTVFNVYAPLLEGYCETTLIEGGVQVNVTGDRISEQQVNLVPGQQFTYDTKAKRQMLKEVDVDLYAKWKDERLKFSNQAFSNLLLVLERRYQVKFKVLNKSLYEYHYDGVIRDESLTEVLDIISMILPINYKINNNEVILTKKQD